MNHENSLKTFISISRSCKNQESSSSVNKNYFQLAISPSINSISILFWIPRKIMMMSNGFKFKVFQYKMFPFSKILCAYRTISWVREGARLVNGVEKWGSYETWIIRNPSSWEENVRKTFAIKSFWTFWTENFDRLSDFHETGKF